MTAGRIVSTVISCAVVAGCAVVVVGMTRANSEPRPDERAAAASAAVTDRPAYLPAPVTSSTARRPAVVPATSARIPAATITAAPARRAPVVAPAVTTPNVAAPPAAPPATAAPAATPVTTRPAAVAPRPVVRAVAPARTTTKARAPAVRRAPAPTAAKPAGSKLPLRYTTGTATRVLTVTAGSSRSTRATLQAWTKLSNGRWKKYGASVKSYVGSDGIGSASETRSKTPAGSFTVTTTFGRNANPGTKLPYVKTTPSDYWISSPGSKYNTRQRCSSCGYNNGVNERLYYTTPFYNYAAVIDYNTRNAPGGVKQGRGSAFFLHVSTGAATAGCVAIPQTKLVSLLRWLTPSAHPRILIGVT